MVALNTARRFFAQSNGIARTADMHAAGLSVSALRALSREGHIRRIRHGWYQLAEQEYVPEEQLLASLLPEAVLCVESALHYYGYSDFTPRQWCIAVPRSVSPSRMRTELLHFKAYYIPDELHPLGKASAEVNGVVLPIYDRERTICDCFKYKSRLDREMFAAALRAYAEDERKNLPLLYRYARKMGLTTKVNDIMEVLLHE